MLAMAFATVLDEPHGSKLELARCYRVETTVGLSTHRRSGLCRLSFWIAITS